MTETFFFSTNLKYYENLQLDKDLIHGQVETQLKFIYASIHVFDVLVISYKFPRQFSKVSIFVKILPLQFYFGCLRCLLSFTFLLLRRRNIFDYTSVLSIPCYDCDDKHPVHSVITHRPLYIPVHI